MAAASSYSVFHCSGVGDASSPDTVKAMSGSAEAFEQLYTPPKYGYDPRRLTQASQKMNDNARSVLVFWLIVNTVLTVLYLIGVLSANAVILVVMVYYLCDAFCMVIWCPLQTVFMKSRCCVDCRIYGWG